MCNSTCAGEGHKAAKTRIKEANVSNVAKVVGVSKLKTKYEVRWQWHRDDCAVAHSTVPVADGRSRSPAQCPVLW